jgi:ribulose-5-phosphate 4-epimerase/fuculose-1-phosphate aldolase
MHEGIANHFSVAVNDSGSQFLVNPYGRHFSRMRASDLLLIDADDPQSRHHPDLDPTAWCIHGAMHRRAPHARCIMHVHSRFATVLATLTDSRLPAIDQTTARFFNDVVVDERFDGLGLDEEAERLAGVVEGKAIVVMGNHGFMALGPTVAKVFDDLYYFERGCETVIRAYQTSREIRHLSDEVAAKTARQSADYPEAASRHLAAIRDVLDTEGADYKD